MKIKRWFFRPSIGTRIEIIGDHPWVGHRGKVIRHWGFDSIEVELEDPDFRCYISSAANIKILE